MSTIVEPSLKEQSLSTAALTFVRSVGSATNLPAFVRNVRTIASVASNLEARVALLEEAIMKDMALTGKVLRIASSAMTGSSQPMTSVKQAIMMLGYDRVQYLSTSTSVFDQIEKNAPAVQDLLVLSVLTANQSLCLASRSGYGRPELAYLCGLFRSLGEVLVACYRSKQYREWIVITISGQKTRASAEERHFGFTFDDVGMVLAQRWGMPVELVTTRCRIAVPTEAPRDRLHLITQFSADLVRLQYGPNGAPQSDAEVNALIASYTSVLGVEAKVIGETTDAARVESRPTLDAMQVSLDGWLAAREQRATPPLTQDEADAQSLADLTATAAPRVTDTIQEAQVRFALHALTTQRLAGAEVTVAGATSAILDAARRAGFRRSLLALSTEDFKMVRGRIGSGPGHEELVRTFVVRPLGTFGALGTALQNRTDLFIDIESQDGKMFARDRLVREFEARSFALLPLVLENKLIGCLYFDSGPEVVEATETVCGLLKTMRDHLASAFAKHRQIANANAA